MFLSLQELIKLNTLKKMFFNPVPKVDLKEKTVLLVLNDRRHKQKS